MLNLFTDHLYLACPCIGFSRVICTEYPVKAEIIVRDCQELQTRPILAALEAYGRSIGRKILTKKEAESMAYEYSCDTIANVFHQIRPVYKGGFNSYYYLWRDVAIACKKNPRPKCKTCGRRDCRDFGHKEIELFNLMINKEKGSYVYFLLHEPTKILKVGISRSPAKRIQAHRASTPGDLTLLGVVPGGSWLEKGIHLDLDDYLAPGNHEWFYYTDYVKNYVNRIIEAHEKNLDKLSIVNPKVCFG